MLENVAELYAHIFLFLSNYMDWLMRKRYKKLLDSFNDNVNKKFDKDLQRINDKSKMIRNLVAQGSRAEVRENRLNLENLGRDIRIGQRGMEDFSSRLLRELQQAQEERGALSVGFRELSARLTDLTLEFASGSIGRWHVEGGEKPNFLVR